MNKKAFMDKACEWIDGFLSCSRLFEYQVTEEEKKETIEDFKMFMDNFFEED